MARSYTLICSAAILSCNLLLFAGPATADRSEALHGTLSVNDGRHLLSVQSSFFKSRGNQNEGKGDAGGQPVILTATDVTSALDIEQALDSATQSGSKPGVVILDGSKGNFVFTGDDKSINVGLSHFRLIGIHHATIANCDDGLFFNASAVSDIQIQSITFKCVGNGITDGTLSAPRHNISVHNNTFQVLKNGILISEISDWKIFNNTINASLECDAGTDCDKGVYLGTSVGSQIFYNKISGITGLSITKSSRLTESSKENEIINRVVSDAK